MALTFSRGFRHLLLNHLRSLHILRYLRCLGCLSGCHRFARSDAGGLNSRRRFARRCRGFASLGLARGGIGHFGDVLAVFMFCRSLLVLFEAVWLGE